MSTHPQAALAVKAAKGINQWGRAAAVRFAIKNRVPSRLFHLAASLEEEQQMLKELHHERHS